MQLPDDKDEGRTIILKSTLLLVAITVNALELFLPRIPILPWFKPGLANCVTIVWIIRYGGIEALFFSLLRIWLVSFYFGFSFISISLSLSGGVLATCVMGFVWHTLGRRNLIGTIGTAILGAMFHNTGQLIAVFYILTFNVYLFYQIPFMIIASILFGTIVGILSPMLAKIAARVFEKTEGGAVVIPVDLRLPGSYTTISVAMLTLSISLVFIDNHLLLLIFAFLITTIVQIIMRGSLKALFFPIRRFWLLFLFVAVLLLLVPYGKKIVWAPWISYDSLEATGKQWLRLWTWLEISFIFTHFRFHAVIFRVLSIFFKSHRTTLYAGLLAAEDFPGVFDLMQKRISMEFRAMLRHPIMKSKDLVKTAFHDIADYIAIRHREIAKEEQP